MNKNAYLGLPLIFAALWHQPVLAAEIAYPPTSSNVSYGDVQALPSRPEDETHYYGKDMHQFARLWLPENSHKEPKLIVLIHGGCWLNAFDMSHTFPLATMLSQAGYTVWSLEYRRTGDTGGGWPGSFEDIQQGINLLSGIENHGLNSAQMAIVGHSAGGHLALLAGNVFSQAKSIIGLAAISDIEKYSLGNNDCQTATPLFMGGSYAEHPALYNAANPRHQGVHTNTTMLQGTADNIVDSSQASINGAAIEIIEGAGHFDWVHPGTPAVKRLLQTLEEAF